MATPNGTTASAPSENQPSPDLAARATAHVETVVEFVRDKSTVPALKIAEVLIFSFAMVALLLAAGILLAAAVLKLLDDLVFHQRVWASYTVLGGVFTLVGMGLLSRRHPHPEKTAH